MGNKLSPISQFLDRFLQGVQVYQSFQEMESRRKLAEQQGRHLDLQSGQLEMQRQQMLDKQIKNAQLEEIAKGLEQETTRTTSIPGATPGDITPTLAPPPYGQQPGGYSISPGSRLAPEIGLAPIDITTQVPPTPDQTMQAAAVRFAGSPAILEMLRNFRRWRGR